MYIKENLIWAGLAKHKSNQTKSNTEGKLKLKEGKSNI